MIRFIFWLKCVLSVFAGALTISRFWCRLPSTGCFSRVLLAVLLAAANFAVSFPLMDSSLIDYGKSFTPFFHHIKAY